MLSRCAIEPVVHDGVRRILRRCRLWLPRRSNIRAGKMLAVVGAARMLRFTGLGILAFFYGRHILKWAASPAVEYFLVGLIVLSIAGSAISVYGWIKRSRNVR